MKTIIDFLTKLQKNNNKEWFHAHRSEYEHEQGRFNEFAQKFIAGIAEIDPSTNGLTLKECTYRIYRDTRFSNDKSPYKTHMGVFVAPEGKKSGKAGYYFHVSTGGNNYPNGNMLALGHYCYDKKVVEIVREDLVDDGEKFEKMILSAQKCGFTLDMQDSLKRIPRGFENVNPKYSDYLRLKSYLIRKTLSKYIWR